MWVPPLTLLAKMLTSHATFGEQNEAGSGYGVVLIRRGEHPATALCGRTLGHVACLMRALDDGISVVMLGNQADTDRSISGKLTDIALGIPLRHYVSDNAIPSLPPPSPTRGEGERINAWRCVLSPSPLMGEGQGVRGKDGCGA